ncbi:Mannose-6-phosphate isomerase [Lamellibrachia satsuma]|nr:Mannose-6-phosphate isomerase [Lamellibrachia satsuma]
MIEPKVVQLKCAIKNYAWGKVGKSSKVAQLASGTNSSLTASEDVAYAELWMGTHPKGPSIHMGRNIPLSDWLTTYPEFLGDKMRKAFPGKGELPFLFKVLSVGQSLSIQAHPDKNLAERLHREKPDLYPDSNHKPEIAIALTSFDALCGFRPYNEIAEFLTYIPELETVVGRENSEAFKAVASEVPVSMTALADALQRCFTALMTCDVTALHVQLKNLMQRANKENPYQSGRLQSDLLVKLHSQFPGDVGCFVIYFLNRITLQPGEAIFLEAGLPHAYLYGDCIECMACSDNVVRAGLTPKFKDIPLLCSMLKYECKASTKYLFPGVKDPEDSLRVIFNPPVPEFTVDKIKVPAHARFYTLKSLDSGSILIFIEGGGTVDIASLENPLDVCSGLVIFIAAFNEVNINTYPRGIGGPASPKDLVMYRAYCTL